MWITSEGKGDIIHYILVVQLSPIFRDQDLRSTKENKDGNHLQTMPTGSVMRQVNRCFPIFGSDLVGVKPLK